MIRIAIDAMGGDHGPRSIVAGALAAARRAEVGVTLVGDGERIEGEMARYTAPDPSRVRVIHAEQVIGMSEAPAAALRRKPDASIRIAAESVARGEAAALFSAGHTGATVMAAHRALGMLPGVDRPALAITIPSGSGAAVLVDVGANARCRASHLVQFALMGRAFARLALGVERPRVGLLSIGEEETKGNELTQRAFALLKAQPINFIGNVEARDVYSGQADVIVCDGFTGNIALKISESLVELVERLIRDELVVTRRRRAGPSASRRVLERFRRRLDYSEYRWRAAAGRGGAVRGGPRTLFPKAVRNAIILAARFAAQDLVGRIARETALTGAC